VPPRGGGFIGEAVKVWREKGLDDPATKDRLMDLWVRAEVLRLTNIRASHMRAVGTPGPEGSIGKIVSAHNKAHAYWAISGRNVPTDAFDVKLAATPRDAARHFALKWQMKAARLESDSKDGLPEVAAGLTQTAEALYALTLDADQWALRE
jgi:hypothetical protein